MYKSKRLPAPGGVLTYGAYQSRVVKSMLLCTSLRPLGNWAVIRANITKNFQPDRKSSDPAVECYCTVKVSVAVCVRALDPEPDVAVTVTVLAPAGVPWLPDDFLPPPPQPTVMAVKPIINTRHKDIGSRFFLPKKNKAKARVIPSPANGQVGMRFSLVAAVVAIVIVVVAAVVPLGVTAEGEKLHVAPDGSPEQAKFTAELKPFIGVTDKPMVALCPGVTETLVEAAASVNDGTVFTVSVMTEEADAANVVSPEYCAVIE